MVQQVEGFEAELKFQPLGDGRGLHGAEVEADVPWPTQHAPTRVAEDLLRGRKSDGGRIPPGQELFRTIVGVSGEAIEVLLEENANHCVIAGLATRAR